MTTVEESKQTQIPEWILDIELCHIVENNKTLCGADDPSDLFCADYDGEAICPSCGNPTCPRCAQIDDLMVRLGE